MIMSASSSRFANRPARTLFPAVAVFTILLVALSIVSLMVGARPISLPVLKAALLHYDANVTEHIIVRDYRLPRLVLCTLCGAAFGTAGALIQAATRNPLADPGILGVNAGAAFAVILAVGVFSFASIVAYVWFALAGAAIAGLLVYVVGTSAGGAPPVRLLLTGVALSAVLGGIGSSITLLDPQAFDSMRHWQVGTVGGRNMNVAVTVAPFIALGLCLALAITPALNAAILGDDAARALGLNLIRLRVAIVIAVTLLAGAATAAVGPITFIGLMVPHAVRWLVGPDQKRIVPLTMLGSAILLIASDIAGRLVIFPDELEAGIVVAFVGAPVLIILARSARTAPL
ncbi:MULTISPECIES: FecCD family ABC transporter permease [unclassified Rhizobium]|uniref:FecCD family ABC transporter permease n=1 Tax=unclassified Rhizobium TaxID=2613769 RepID=UPI001ADC942F|nr:MULTISPECIES: iron chelate uptake ABC transporter family permease subunit [unclassified Rhizobium]MBO9127813.1 iron chelate uptake ABC transporter family permease subunit [Rhizobium sp. 16-488-2b]MBO9178275.1 iron chelate uptake ABC transporter family permease subunit [Rhizobium sp. 16-488-2a]